MGPAGRGWVVLSIALLAATSVHAQQQGEARTAYLGAVASFFDLPPSEVAILADWDIAPDEIPPVLFVAAHAGISPEALVALRRSGVGWSELIRRYQISPSALHVPVRDQAPTGALQSAYEAFRATPVADWPGIRLGDADIVALVNVRVIAQTLGLSAEEVIGHTGSASYVELYVRLKR